MFALNERLSEYAYGFGATTEALALLRSVGVHAVPFLPNLIHEAEVGFDVSFSAPGTILMLQFKLGHQLDRFVRKPANQTPPSVVRPFWRFEVQRRPPPIHPPPVLGDAWRRRILCGSPVRGLAFV